MASVFEVMAKLSANTTNFDAGMKKATQSVEQIETASKKTSEKSGKAFAGLAKGVLGVFAVTGAAVGGVLAKGVGRLVQIEEAEAKLLGLGNTTKSVSAIMDNALSAVRGTAFGMGEAATVAASAVAAGVAPGDQLSKYLKTVADTAYIAGASMEEMGYVLNQTITSGKATNETLSSLAGRGIPAYQMLADQMGVTSDAVFEMASKGEISADMLQKALNDKIGGAALKSGDTVQGSMANMQAAFQRVGANIAGPVYDQFQGFFSSVITAMGPLEARAKEMGVEIGAAMQPVMESLIDIFMPLIELVFDLITPLLGLINALKPLFDVIKPVAELFGNMVKAVLPPLINIVGVLSGVMANLITTLIPIIEEIFPTFVDILENFLIPAIEAAASFIGFMAEAMLGNEKAVSRVIGVLAALAAGIGVFAVATAVANGVTTLMTAKLYLARTAQLLFNIAVMANPYVLAAAALVALIGAIVVFSSETDNGLKSIEESTEKIGVLENELDYLTASYERGVMTLEVYETQAAALRREIDKLTVSTQNSAGELNRFAALEAQSNLAKGNKAWSDSWIARGEAAKKAIVEADIVGAIIDTTGSKTDPFEEFFNGLIDGVAKVKAKIKLQSKGLSEGLITQILGGAEWETVYKKIISGGDKAISSIKKLYTATEEGIAELKQTAEDAQDALDELNNQMAAYVANSEAFTASLKDLFKNANPFAALLDTRGEFEKQVEDTFTGFYEKISSGLKDGLIDDAAADELSLLTARYEQQLSVIAKRVDEINVQLEGLYVIREAAKAYQKGMADILRATQPLVRVAADVGRFEAQVISSFDAVNNKIEDGLSIGLFGETVAAQLKATANQTRSTLTVLARQRDALAKTYNEMVSKLDASRAFRQSTKDAIMGVANVTTIGKSARSIIRNLEKTLERTDRFKDQLGTLQQLGLNKEAYNQIVNSGLDAGTATAKAILRGGPEAVTQLNNLFGKLEVSADSLATDAEKFMFDGGEQSIQGFIDGIVAQDEAVRLTAEETATAFNTTFQGTVDAAQANLDATIALLEGEKDNLVATATMLATAFATEFQTIVNAAFARAQAQIAAAQASAAAAVAAANQAVANANAAAAKATSAAKTATAGATKTSSSGSTASQTTKSSNSGIVIDKASGVISRAGQGIGGNAAPIYVTVNAGLGTSGAKVGQDVARVLTQYSRTSGKIGGTGIIAV